MKTKTEQTKTRQEEIKEQINKMPLDPEYREVPNLPIPLGHAVLVKKVRTSSQEVTEGGIILIDGTTEKSQPPHLGVIQAVGPLCSEYLKVGVRCYYNFFVDSAFRINGVEYAKLDETDVYYLVPPEVRVDEKLLDDTTVRKKKKIIKQQNIVQAIYKDELNEKDKKFDKTKGKIHLIN